MKYTTCPNCSLSPSDCKCSPVEEGREDFREWPHDYPKDAKKMGLSPPHSQEAEEKCKGNRDFSVHSFPRGGSCTVCGVDALETEAFAHTSPPETPDPGYTTPFTSDGNKRPTSVKSEEKCECSHSIENHCKNQNCMCCDVTFCGCLQYEPVQPLPPASQGESEKIEMLAKEIHTEVSRGCGVNIVENVLKIFLASEKEKARQEERARVKEIVESLKLKKVSYDRGSNARSVMENRNQILDDLLSKLTQSK